ncbi:hypothetical protein HYH02_003465 [Chlamydomonas schloesseri]|uniref:GIY-YIG domain-containing protein n=1 Tax=Chlamydomonas schloesseri TaxID=2026947 RepID=A0A836B9U5_9CHLO|nr:hypothetical protein HYH02_003465 [Chlamydomonas schloesseri]|eukprot:KAG2451685.1 hypothetical protein HYH02_003465 [Chlamydomonas schloesseri]
MPHKSGVYWLGLRQGCKVTPLYHGMASFLDERVGQHRKAVEGRGTDVPVLHVGMQAASKVGTVVVRWEETGRYQTAESRELRSRNYPFNSAKNEGYRIKAGLLALGISSGEVDTAIKKL